MNVNSCALARSPDTSFVGHVEKIIHKMEKKTMRGKAVDHECSQRGPQWLTSERLWRSHGHRLSLGVEVWESLSNALSVGTADTVLGIELCRLQGSIATRQNATFKISRLLG